MRLAEEMFDARIAQAQADTELDLAQELELQAAQLECERYIVMQLAAERVISAAARLRLKRQTELELEQYAWASLGQ